MKKILLSLLLASLSIAGMAQYQRVTVRDIQYVDQSKLQNCRDTSAYDGDTVTIVCKVIADANLIDVPSSSVQGGYRPFVHVVDTAENGMMGKFSGIQVMGVYTDSKGTPLPVTDVFNLYAGMIVEMTGKVNSYLGETQFEILNNSSMTVLGSEAAPQPVTIDLGVLNDNTRTNVIPTGEEYEGSFVKIEDLTVSAVYNFSGNRVSFDLTDDNGNVINVSDRFLVQKTPSYITNRASAPYKQGKFVAPVVGTRFDHIMGIIIHSQNGCTGSNGRGYEINPFDTSHYKIGITPPRVSSLVRTPLIPTDQDEVNINAKIVDFDGSVTKATFYYTAKDNFTQSDTFTAVPMTLKTGTTDEFEAKIPAFAEGKTIRYYILAEDDDLQLSYYPFGAADSKNPDYLFYTVRNNGLSIVDLQKVINLSRDASPYIGQEVTVTGVVTASAKAYDLEAIYIQDENETEWAGIQCAGNSDLIKLFRGQVVKVTGTVSESFGFTVLNVSKVENTGRVADVQPIILDINNVRSLVSSREMEMYEGMLIGLQNPGSKVYVSNPRLNNFGEWLVAPGADSSFNASMRVQSGIQNTNNHSSLWVSLVGDTTLKDNEGVMNVAPIATQKGMTFDTLVGINFYGFSTYKLLPRNNDDFRGASVQLPETDYPEIPVGINSFTSESGLFNIYPNPVNDRLNIESEGITSTILAQVYTIQGKLLKGFEERNGNASLDLSDLAPGTYILSIRSGEAVVSFRFVKI